MTEIATFFRHRDDDPGATYQFEVKTEKSYYQFSVYCRKSMGGKLFRSEDAPKDWSVALEKVKDGIEKRGGGIIVTMAGDGPSVMVLVNVVQSSNMRPPTKFVLLEPGMPAYWVPVEKNQKVPAASHVVVPVDADAEERLASFVAQLPWFSPDFEALVLNAIRKPSLDWRLNRVEKHLFDKTDEEARREATARGWARFGMVWHKWRTSTATYAYLFAALLVVLLGVNAYTLHQLKTQNEDKHPGTNPSAPTGATGKTGTTGTTGAAKTKSTLAAATQELLTELRVRKDSNDFIKLLYEKHFQDFDKENLKPEEIDNWYKKQLDNPGSRPFLWGILKLQLMKYKQPSDITFIQKWDNITATKDVVKTLSGQIDSDPDAKKLLAVLACDMGYVSETPTLPKVGKSEALPLMRDTQCSELTNDAIADALPSLTNYVKSLK